LPLLVCKPD